MRELCYLSFVHNNRYITFIFEHVAMNLFAFREYPNIGTGLEERSICIGTYWNTMLVHQMQKSQCFPQSTLPTELFFTSSSSFSEITTAPEFFTFVFAVILNVVKFTAWLLDLHMEQILL